MKKRICRAWDSNPGQQGGRWRLIHWAMAAPQWCHPNDDPFIIQMQTWVSIDSSFKSRYEDNVSRYFVLMAAHNLFIATHKAEFLMPHCLTGDADWVGTQCDQIRNFLKGLGDKISQKSRQNIWQLFCNLEKHKSLSKTIAATIWAFWEKTRLLFTPSSGHTVKALLIGSKTL